MDLQSGGGDVRQRERNHSLELREWSYGGGGIAAEGSGFGALSGPPAGIYTARATAYPEVRINLSGLARYPISGLGYKMASPRISAGLFRVEGLIDRGSARDALTPHHQRIKERRLGKTA